MTDINATPEANLAAERRRRRGRGEVAFTIRVPMRAIRCICGQHTCVPEAVDDLVARVQAAG